MLPIHIFDVNIQQLPLFIWNDFVNIGKTNSENSALPYRIRERMFTRNSRTYPRFTQSFAGYQIIHANSALMGQASDMPLAPALLK